jgi:hypothetical protein
LTCPCSVFALSCFCLGSAWAPCHWFLLLGHVGVAFIERRLSLLILFVIFFDLPNMLPDAAPFRFRCIFCWVWALQTQHAFSGWRLTKALFAYFLTLYIIRIFAWYITFKEEIKLFRESKWIYYRLRVIVDRLSEV